MTLGRRGEQLAIEHLIELGWQIIETNWRCRSGEIDVVALDAETVVFVEVKTRGSLSAGHPLEAVTARKLATLRTLARSWLREQPSWFPLIRIDVIGIVWNDGLPDLTHVRDAQ